MAVEYINFKNQNYYLHSSITKKGNPRFYFSLKKPSIPVPKIPKGYEIYENANGQVYLRKILKSLITSAELDTVYQSIIKYSKLNNVKVDLKKKHILLFIPDQDVVKLSIALKSLAPHQNSNKITNALNDILTYSAVMRFELCDTEKRLFIPERCSYMGREEMWIQIGESEKIVELCKKYLKHLGQESFFELGIF